MTASEWSLRIVRVLLATGVALWVGASVSRADVQPLPSWRARVDGGLLAAVAAGDRVILGGTFSAHYQPSEALGFVDAVTGSLLPGCATATGLSSPPMSDGAGGVFIWTFLGVGSPPVFTDAGGALVPPPNTAFLRVRPDCRFDRTFMPGPVDPARPASPRSVLGVGGAVLATSARPGATQVAAFDATTGARIAFREYGSVFGMDLLGLANGQSVVVRVGDSSTSASQSLRLLSLPSLELSGPLQVVGDGQTRTWLTNGRVFAWRPPTFPSNAPTPLFAFDSETLQPWPGWLNPAISGIADLVAAGDRVFLAGTVQIDNQVLPPPVALDAATGTLDASWTPPLISSMQLEPAAAIRRLTSDGAQLFAQFNTSVVVAGQWRAQWVALDVATAELRPWTPTVLRADSDSGIVTMAGALALGRLSGVGAVRRSGLSIVDRATGALLPVDPMTEIGESRYRVWSLASNATHVFVAFQDPLQLQREVRRLAIDTLAWDPDWVLVPLGATQQGVRAMAATDTTLYLGGAFTGVTGTIGGTPVPVAWRNGLASVDLTGGVVHPWNPDVTAVSPFDSVQSVALANDRLYVAGAFTAVGGQPRSGFAAVDLVSGATTGSAVPGLTTASRVVTDGQTAFVLGTSGGFPILAAVPPAGGSTVVTISGSTTPTALAVLEGRVYAGRERDVVSLQPTGSTLTFEGAFGLPSSVIVTRDVGLLSYHAYEVPAVPGAPTDLVAVPNGNQVTLTWSPSPASDPAWLGSAFGAATSYVVRAGSGPGLFNLADADTGSLATSLSAQAPDGTYFVRVHGRNAFGLGPSSNEVQFVLGSQPCPGPPGAPGPLTALVSGTQVAFAWGAAAGAASYVLQAGAASGGTELASVNVGAGVTFGTSAPPGTYYVRVRASNACGLGPSSNEVVVTLASTVVVPGPPATPAYVVDGSTVTVTWAPPAGGGAPTGYRLEAGSQPGLSDIAVATTVATNLVARNVPAGTYHVRIRATNAAGVGQPSEEVVIVVP